MSTILHTAEKANGDSPMKADIFHAATADLVSLLRKKGASSISIHIKERMKVSKKPSGRMPKRLDSLSNDLI